MRGVRRRRRFTWWRRHGMWIVPVAWVLFLFGAAATAAAAPTGLQGLNESVKTLQSGVGGSPLPETPASVVEAG